MQCGEMWAALVFTRSRTGGQKTTFVGDDWGRHLAYHGRATVGVRVNSACYFTVLVMWFCSLVKISLVLLPLDGQAWIIGSVSPT